MSHDQTLDLCRRNSFTKTHIVDLACCYPDIRAAAALLARHGVSFDVAHRVLLYPRLRRRLS